MSLRLCLACAHPLIYHTSDGCTEVMDYDDSNDGDVQMCPCDRPGWGTP